MPVDSYQQNWSPELDVLLSDIAKGTRAFVKPRKESEKTRFMRATAEVFEIIGGVPRFALWADQNPDKFYSLCGKTIPGVVAQTNLNLSGNVTIVSALGPPKNEQEPLEGEATELPNAG